jgi:hypothetical protein
MNRKLSNCQRIAVFTAVLILISMAGHASDVKIDASGEWRYVLEADGATITGFSVSQINRKPEDRKRGLHIPGAVDGYKVIGIGPRAFTYATEATILTFPDSVTSIGDKAFECGGFTSITIPNTITSMGFNPFQECPLKAFTVADDHPVFMQIDGVLIDKEQRKIVSYPFAKEGPYTIPEEVQRIGEYAFSYCEGLPAVTIPDGVYHIGKGAFYSTNIKDISLPSSVTSIEPYTFKYCKRLTGIHIPAGVTGIGDSAFYECDRLMDLTLPDSVKSIGEEAFQSCLSLFGLNIPSSVTDIGDSAFADCARLTLTVTKGSYAEQYAKENGIPYQVVQSQSETAAHSYPQKIMLQNKRSVNIRSGPGKEYPQIGEAYPGLSFYFTGTIENGFYQIQYPSLTADSGFVTAYVVESLASVSPADSQDLILSTHIGSTKVKENAKAYLDADLRYASELKIGDPNSVPYAGIAPNGSYAVLLHSVSGMGEVILWLGFVASEDIVPVGSGAFEVPPETKIVTEDPWTYAIIGSEVTIQSMKNPEGKVVIPGKLGGYPVTGIGDSAFAGAADLTGITLPKSLKRIEAEAFTQSGLTAVTIPNSVTVIGEWAFKECYDLAKVTIGKGVTSIGADAFFDCDSLTRITLPTSVTDIGEGAFDAGAFGERERFTLTVTKGSYAESYAKENDIPYTFAK